MKFKKFVKSLGADGILYVRENGDRWLSSGSIFMKVPEDIRTVTACDSASMLSLIENIINYDTFSQPCELVEAVMPCCRWCNQGLCAYFRHRKQH